MYLKLCPDRGIQKQESEPEKYDVGEHDEGLQACVSTSKF